MKEKSSCCLQRNFQLLATNKLLMYIAIMQHLTQLRVVFRIIFGIILGFPIVLVAVLGFLSLLVYESNYKSEF